MTVQDENTALKIIVIVLTISVVIFVIFLIELKGQVDSANNLSTALLASLTEKSTNCQNSTENLK